MFRADWRQTVSAVEWFSNDDEWYIIELELEIGLVRIQSVKDAKMRSMIF